MLLNSSNVSLRALTDFLCQLQAQLRETNQRKLLCVQGERQWCDDIINIVQKIIIQQGVVQGNASQSNQQHTIAISDRHLRFESVAYSKVETLLGTEASLVVVDLFEGINPDVLCIASGLLKQGGLLLLLSDKPENWSAANDKFGSWQNGAKKTDNFVHYFFKELARYPQACVFLKQDEELPPLKKIQPADGITMFDGKTQEQLDILDRLDGWLVDPTQSIMLIKADRGRGKSTCLGFIVQALKSRPGSRPGLKLMVSAYSKLSASILLQQAGDIEFIAPDQLIKEKNQADVLIIDEAAMLPFPMLQQLVKRYKKIVMATTTGGYEGTGQGFMHRFQANLPSDKLLSLSIDNPVRWATQDDLEPCLNSVLQLNPKLHSIAKQTLSEQNPAQQSMCSDISYRVVNVNSGTDTALLKQVYELMASVHYRTRPSDLRMLMDNPDLSLVLAEQGDHLIGVLVLNREGGFDSDLCEQVYLGKRRPKGHLLAQMLTAQASIKSFACYQGIRIQRIAVIPSIRRRGIGDQLIKQASEYARDLQYDYIGACFAFDAEVSLFWRHCQFPLVHISFSQGKSTGNHSVAVLKPLTKKLEFVKEQLQTRLQKQLPVWLTHYLSDMDVQTIIALLRFSGFESRQNELDQAEIDAFVSGFKGFDLSYASLQPYVMQLIAQSCERIEVHDWLVEKVIQNKPWEHLTSHDNIVGRKQCQQKLRSLILNLR